MSLVPVKLIDKVQFYENHVDPWTINAVGIGTTTTIMTDLAGKITAARAAFTAQQAAQEDAKAATLAWQSAVIAMAAAGSDVVKQIRAKAGASGDSVYVLAQIPAPATPTPAPPPGKPSDFTVSLEETGALNLAWKCTNPAGGTIYQIYRRVGATGEFVFLGATGSKTFVDNTVPAGSSALTYQIQAVRSTSVGAWAQFNVNFGAEGSGGAVRAFVTESAPPPQAKLAA
jgi:hypothetical protein